MVSKSFFAKKLSTVLLAFIVTTALYALPAVVSPIADTSGEYVFYRDNTFTRPSYIGFIYYDDATYAVRYYAPAVAEQFLPEKDITLYLTVNKDSAHLEFTGETMKGVVSDADTDVVNYMPETMSVERRALLKAYGAEIVLTDGAAGMQGAVDKANELAAKTPHSFIPGQFDNPVNPETHFKTTGPEIWEDTDGHVDAFIAGVGTGGTLTGVGKFLKSKKASVKVIAVEPATSPLLSKGHAGPHKIQGIGANFIPKTLDQSVYDVVVPVQNEDAFTFGKEIAKTEGVLVGISAGAALWAAVEEAKKTENAGKTIVALLPDTGDRYLSTPLFEA